MKKLYAPWRHRYVTGQEKKKKPLKNNCIFCENFSHDPNRVDLDNNNKDKENLILKRFKNSAIIINAYPYNAGHLMVLPLEHKSSLHELTPEVRTELIEATSITTQIIQDEMKNKGFNIGINLGETGGGGIPSHLHIHILPRWHGDTNFLATLCDTTVISSDFYEIYDSLKERFQNITI